MAGRIAMVLLLAGTELFCAAVLADVPDRKPRSRAAAVMCIEVHFRFRVCLITSSIDDGVVELTGYAAYGADAYGAEPFSQHTGFERI